MHLFYTDLPIYVGYPLLPGYYAPGTFVAATNTAAMTPMAAPAPAPAPAPPPAPRPAAPAVQYLPLQGKPLYLRPGELSPAEMWLRQPHHAPPPPSMSTWQFMQNMWKSIFAPTSVRTVPGAVKG